MTKKYVSFQWAKGYKFHNGVSCTSAIHDTNYILAIEKLEKTNSVCSESHVSMTLLHGREFWLKE